MKQPSLKLSILCQFKTHWFCKGFELIETIIFCDLEECEKNKIKEDELNPKMVWMKEFFY